MLKLEAQLCNANRNFITSEESICRETLEVFKIMDIIQI